MLGKDQICRGGCLCGSVRYVATGHPQASAICHCRSCQKAFGAASVAWACFDSDQVQWEGNGRRIFESSQGVERSFCECCGTSISYQTAGNTIDLSLATLDDPEALQPEREVYLSHRISWNVHNQNLPGHQKFKSDEQ